MPGYHTRRVPVPVGGASPEPFAPVATIPCVESDRPTAVTRPVDVIVLDDEIAPDVIVPDDVMFPDEIAPTVMSPAANSPAAPRCTIAFAVFSAVPDAFVPGSPCGPCGPTGP